MTPNEAGIVVRTRDQGDQPVSKRANTVDIQTYVKNRITCAACGYAGGQAHWADSWCPRCQAFHLGLYRADHLNRSRARTLTLAEARAEFAAAGLPFRPIRCSREDMKQHRGVA